MQAPLDLNGNPILNLPTPVNPTDVVRLSDLEPLINPIPYVQDLVDIVAEYANEVADDAAAADADAASAAADATDAEAAAAQALQARNEAAAFAAAIPPGTTYADDAAGRAAVADGAMYWLRTSDGLRLKTRVSSGVSADVLVGSNPVIIMSLNGMYSRVPYVRMTTTMGVVNDYTIQAKDPNIRFTGDGSQYVFAWEAPAANTLGSGSISLTVKDGAGTTFVTRPLRKRGNIPLDGTEFAQGDLIEARILTAAESVFQQMLWLSPPSSAVKIATTVAKGIDDWGKNPSKDRPVHYYKAGTEEHYINMRLTEPFYATGQSRRHSDMLRIVEKDMARFQSDTGTCLSLNSMFSRVQGRSCHDLNMLFDSLSGGATVDTGRVPTTLETPVNGGKFGDGVGLYTTAGCGHGSVVGPVTTMATVLNDATTGNVDSAGTINPSGDIGTVFYGDKIVKTLTMLAENAAHDIYAKLTYVTTYDPTATDGQVRIQTTWDFTDAAVTVTPGYIRGFAMLFAGTDLNRCAPVVNGVRQPTVIIDKRDGSDSSIGFPEQVIFWHSDFPEKQIVVTNHAGYGYTHRENGVLVPNTIYPAYVDNFDWGVKLYAGQMGDQTGVTPRNMTGIVITADTSYKWQIADPIV